MRFVYFMCLSSFITFWDRIFAPIINREQNNGEIIRRRRSEQKIAHTEEIYFEERPSKNRTNHNFNCFLGIRIDIVAVTSIKRTKHLLGKQEQKKNDLGASSSLCT